MSLEPSPPSDVRGVHSDIVKYWYFPLRAVEDRGCRLQENNSWIIEELL
jgi:hypothetical protein